jgi:opacity protein-like surface antigen
MKSSMKRLLLASISAALLAGAGASAALAGEVKGPPGVPYNTNYTRAPLHANSACAYSGLNDLNPAYGQTASQVQTAADSFKYYNLSPGVEGTAGLCQSGTNPHRL